MPDSESAKPAGSTDDRPERPVVALARAVGVIAGGVVLAVVLVLILKRAGTGPQLQRAVAFACVGIPLFGLAVFVRRAVPNDALSAAGAIIGISAVAVAGLTYLGAVDKDASFGCLTSHGPIDVTASSDHTVVFSEATAASDARHLLVRGCELHGVAWCVGAVHADALEPNVFDARWLVLSGNQGLVPIGWTVGGPLPESERDHGCKGGVASPESIEFTSARVDRKTGLLAVAARATNAAFIGFAVRRSDGRWERLGWDYEPTDAAPVVLPAADPPARVDDEVAAVACVGYQQPAVADDGTIVVQSAGIKAGGRFKTPRPPAAQPKRSTAAQAACAASEPRPAPPYTAGTVAG